jgi:hypothetical protein
MLIALISPQPSMDIAAIAQPRLIHTFLLMLCSFFWNYVLLCLASLRENLTAAGRRCQKLYSRSARKPAMVSEGCLASVWQTKFVCKTA